MNISPPRTPRRYTVVVAALGAAVSLTSGCALNLANAKWYTTTYAGEAQSVGHGTARPYVIIDQDGNPTEVGVRLSATALDGLPTEDTVPPTETILEFPKQAKATVFNHVMLNWYSHGRKPAEIFGEPHFAFHFYTPDHHTVMDIDPKLHPDRAGKVPEKKYIAPDYISEPGNPVEMTKPQMGLHWIDTTRHFGPVGSAEEFREVFVYGSHDGRLIFQEPLATRKWLLTKPTFKSDIRQPQEYQRTGYYPTFYGIKYDAATNDYVISLGGMRMRKAT
ncbi:DUF5602 domain-containing protein [Microbispora sp. NBC_01189]|uniref:DUF5602 domain-containing protein n=1 Tax=Microbispora sp. NBC_01189 TaxID=2903583 RepID=UPI002E0D3EC0|nr:DUF5602 domain-containing protein [Microbispora sp. NBC_01189]